MRVNCLLRNTAAVKEIRDIMRVMVADRIEAGESALFGQVYSDIRKAGIEVDAESVGAIYNGLYGMYKVDYISSADDVAEFAGRDVVDLMEKITDDVLTGTKPTIIDQLGRTSPERSATNSIAKIFQNATFGTSPKVQTVMRQMEDMVTKAAKSFLPPGAKSSPLSLTDALDKFFEVEDHTFTRLSGGVNTLETLTDAVKKEVKAYVDNIASMGKLTPEEISLLRDQWDTYTDGFINSTYDIFLNKGNQNSLVNEALQQVQINGVSIVDLNGNVKWSALLQYGNPDTIVDSVKELFENGIKDKSGNVVKYTSLQAERIGEYFRKVYEEKLKKAKSRALNNSRARNNSPSNIISDYLKDRGFFNLMKDKNGRLLLSQSDWDGFIDAVREQLGRIDLNNLKRDISGIDFVTKSLQDYLSTLKDKDGNPYSAYQKQLITERMVDVIAAKLTPNVADATDIERLIALDTINKGNAFNETTQQAVNKVVGVSDLSQDVLNKLRGLANTAKAIMNNHVGTGNVVPVGTVNRAAFAFQAMAEVDRRIKQIIRENNINKSSQQRIVKYVNDIIGGGNVSLLLNPNNAIENVVTQIGSNLSETLNLFRTDPKLAADLFFSTQKAFFKSWFNYAAGGASNELANEGELSNELQSSERLTVGAAKREIKEKGGMGALSVAFKIPAYLVSIISRTFMNSFDAATTASLMRKRMVQSTYQSLIDAGNTPAQVRQMMLKVANMNPAVEQEIDRENARIKSLLQSAGIYVSDAMMIQNKSDMFLSVYEDVIRGAAQNAGASVKQAVEITKALVESSQNQSKALGGKKHLLSQDIISNIIYAGADWILRPQKRFFERSKQYEADANLKKAAQSQLYGSLYQMAIGKFVGGVANFMNLALSATPLGFLQANSLNIQRKEYAKNNGGFQVGKDFQINVFDVNPETVRRYSEFHGQMRSIFTRAVAGSTIMAGFIIKAVWDNRGDDDDEDESAFKNLMATKTGKRFLQKHLPLGVSMLVPWFYGGTKNDKAFMVMDMFNIYTGQDFDRYQNLMQALKKAKTDDDRNEVWSKFMGNMMMTYNVNQVEQITKFRDAFASAMDSNEISAVEWDEKVSKDIYKQADGIVDNFFINGVFQAVNRFISDGNFNRYK